MIRGLLFAAALVWSGSAAAHDSRAAERHVHGASDGAGRHTHHGHARGQEPRGAPTSAPAGKAHGVESENLFGFISGSDVEHAGARGVAVEVVLRSGKRAGAYTAIGQKLEVAYGVTDDFSVAGALLGSYHRIARLPGFDDVDTFRFNGLGAEARWRLLRRDVAGFGVTLQLEPVWARSDETSGLAGSKWGLENKLIVDTALIPDRLLGAFNLLHEVERVRERGASEVERGSKVGVGAALAALVSPNLTLGVEARYLHAYEGLMFESFAGRALSAGPTLHASFASGAWVSAAWSIQVAGQAKGDGRSLDLDNFERHAVRVKAGFAF